MLSCAHAVAILFLMLLYRFILVFNAVYNPIVVVNAFVVLFSCFSSVLIMI